MRLNANLLLKKYVGFHFPWLVCRGSALFRKITSIGIVAKFLSKRKKSAAIPHPTPAQKKGNLDKLRDCLLSNGVKDGSTVMLFSSYDEISKLGISPMELINFFREIIGAGGTLCMPAFPLLKKDQNIFSVVKTPSSNGIISEIFRRDPNGLRSCQRRSVAALGPLAEYLLRDHHLDPYTCGKNSPYARLAEIKAKVVCLGVPAKTNTMFHCAEDMMGDNFPIKIYDKTPFEMLVITKNEQALTVKYYEGKIKWYYRCDANNVLQYLDASILKTSGISGVQIHVFDCALFLDKLLSLAAQNIHLYL